MELARIPNQLVVEFARIPAFVVEFARIPAFVVEFARIPNHPVMEFARIPNEVRKDLQVKLNFNPGLLAKSTTPAQEFWRIPLRYEDEE